MPAGPTADQPSTVVRTIRVIFLCTNYDWRN